jgi:probable rRNA maturation factor
MCLPSKKAIEKLIVRVIEREGLEGNVGVIFVDDSYMTELNRKFREKTDSTDVLAFPLKDGSQKGLLGEVYISFDRARRQAKEYGEPLERELRRLVVHGLLHLAGYTHRQMRTKQEEYINL